MRRHKHVITHLDTNSDTSTITCTNAGMSVSTNLQACQIAEAFKAAGEVALANAGDMQPGEMRQQLEV